MFWAYVRTSTLCWLLLCILYKETTSNLFSVSRLFPPRLNKFSSKFVLIRHWHLPKNISYFLQNILTITNWCCRNNFNFLWSKNCKNTIMKNKKLKSSFQNFVLLKNKNKTLTSLLLLKTKDRIQIIAPWQFSIENF